MLTEKDREPQRKDLCASNTEICCFLSKFLITDGKIEEKKDRGRIRQSYLEQMREKVDVDGSYQVLQVSTFSRGVCDYSTDKIRMVNVHSFFH